MILSSAITLTACVNNSAVVSNNPAAVPTVISSNNGDIVLTQFQTIDNAITDGNYPAAQQNLNQLSAIAMTNPSYRSHFILLQSKLSLLSGNPQQSLQWLNQLSSASELNDAQRNYILQLRAQALCRTNQVLLSMITMMSTANDTTTNQYIWQNLLTISPAELRQQQAQESHPLIVGWLSLAEIAQNNANDLTALQQALHSWQQQYQQHPGNQLLASASYNNLISQNNDAEQSLAVILPLSGDYTALGANIQNGFLSAYYSANAIKPSIDFYDASAEKISAIYANIKTRGNTMIVGPLIKDDVEDLLSIAENNPQIISLNYTAEAQPATHLEFGLSPENEAQQVAKLAWRLGQSRALIIAPKSDKGKQTANAFAQQWSSLGGQVMDSYYFADNDDFSKSIGSFLGSADSRTREHVLYTTIKTHFNSHPYFRHDADMIFLVADPTYARQIRPFISFYSGDYFSVFATSSVYTGFHHPSKDKDLNNVYFCDMPGLFQEKHRDRLDLLGQDGYLLASQQLHLNTLPAFPLMGATGQLTVNSQGKIQRELVCAKFKNGEAILLN